MVTLELLLVLLLILTNGFLSMSEFAVVSSRRARLQAMAKAKARGAASAIALTENPGRFLSTVQIGITLVGVLTGAFSGTRIATPFAAYLEGFGLTDAVADAVAFAVVVTGITFFSLILGELVPKQLALRDPERVAGGVAPAMRVLSRLALPFVVVLDLSARAILRLFGQRAASEQAVTEEEIRMVIAEAELAGVVEPAEKRMISGVIRLGNRTARSLMTPRGEIHWVDLDAEPAAIVAAIRGSRHSRLVAAHGTVDSVVGVVQAKELLDAYLEHGTVDFKAMVREAPVVHDNLDAFKLIGILQASDVHVALVVDEYGTFEGIVTTFDFLEAIAGEFQEAGGPAEMQAVQRQDGSWLIDGAMPADEMAELLAITLEDDRTYETVAGFILDHLHRVPETGDVLAFGEWRFEVVDMDGRRIDKLLAQRATPTDA